MDTRTRQGAFTDRGGRSFNEDAFLAASLPSGTSGPLFLGVVADGVGGQVAGRAASSYAVKVLQEFFQRRSASIAPRNLPELLRQIFYRINSNIYGKASSDPRYAGMGTTLTCLLATKDNVTIAHVGDTRAYIKRGGRLFQITRDHLVEESSNEEVDERFALFEEEPLLIGRVLGAEPEVEVDIYRLDLEEGDVFLLASDGVYRDLEEGEMARILEESEGAEEAARRLVEAAISVGASDNVTAVVWEARELEEALPEEELPLEEAGEAPVSAPAGTGRFALPYQSFFEGMAASGGIEELERLMDLALERELMEGSKEAVGTRDETEATLPMEPASGPRSGMAGVGVADAAATTGEIPSSISPETAALSTPGRPEPLPPTGKEAASFPTEKSPLAFATEAPTAPSFPPPQVETPVWPPIPSSASAFELGLPETPPVPEAPTAETISAAPPRQPVEIVGGAPGTGGTATFPAEKDAGREDVVSGQAVPEEADSVMPLPRKVAPKPSHRGWKAAAVAAALILLVAGGVFAFTLGGGKKKKTDGEGERLGLEVPALKGFTLEEAVVVLDSAGIEYEVREEADLLVEKGRVIKSVPEEGKPLVGGQKLILLVSAGPPGAGAMVVLPDLTGVSEEEAEATLQAAGLAVASLSEAHDEGVPQGHVCSQDPPPGTPVAPGSAISLVISLGPQEPAGPQLVTCPTCGGTGKVTCPTCRGRGKVAR